MIKAMPKMPPAMHAKTIKTALKSVRPKINKAGTVNIIPADAPLTELAMVWLMLFSTILLRPIMPRRIPNPKIAASSEPSMEKPSIKLA